MTYFLPYDKIRMEVKMKEFLVGHIYDIIYILGIVAGMIYSIIVTIKNKKTNNIKTLFTAKLEELICEAEKFLNYTGEEKKQYVISRAKSWLSENNAIKKFSDSTISAMIENVITLSKSVNKREKDNVEVENGNDA